MGLLWVSGKMGTLMCGIGNVWLGALFKVVELANDVPEVETFIMWGCIIMMTE